MRWVVEDRWRDGCRSESSNKGKKESFDAMWRNSIQEHVRICCLGTVAPQQAWRWRKTATDTGFHALPRLLFLSTAQGQLSLVSET